VLVVGLTGGIGSGKTTVSSLLAARGAVVIDADRVAREAVAPGGPAYEGVVRRFGPGILRPDGSIDRPRLAEVVFADPASLADLNSLIHPHVREAMAGRLAALAGSDRVVVLDIPLLAESRRDAYPVAGVLVVDAPHEVALRRLVEGRGMAPEEARARMAAQASREERLAVADFVIDNSGDRGHLDAEVDRAWAWVQGLAQRAGGQEG
jgi:dephospho-CoA kinase